MNRIRSNRGFTLIEVMIVVVIVAILASVAFPSYQAYVDRSNRLAAQQFMLEVANRAEEYRLDRRVYPPNLAAVASAPADVTKHFTITLAPTSAGFTITATPTAAASASLKKMELLSSGERTPSDQW